MLFYEINTIKRRFVVALKSSLPRRKKSSTKKGVARKKTFMVIKEGSVPNQRRNRERIGDFQAEDARISSKIDTLNTREKKTSKRDASSQTSAG